MTTIYTTHPRYVEHTLSGHPEHSGRIQSVWETLNTSGLAARMTQIEATMATDEQILYVHTKEYLDLLNIIAIGHGLVMIGAGMDTYALPVSPEIARLAAGGVIQAVDEVLRGNAHNGLAVVRPPGHHAIPQRGMGFCLLGNIAMAARHAQYIHGVERILIVDFDVHHGNGTQDMFYDDDGVLFISTHQSPFYPGTGRINETGIGLKLRGLRQGALFRLSMRCCVAMLIMGWQQCVRRGIMPFHSAAWASVYWVISLWRLVTPNIFMGLNAY